MTPTPTHLDVCVLGGGIAGLWTLAHLRRLGYHAALIELDSLGGGAAGQTIASQGIIHGGIKYALTGAASAASRAIASMPDVWLRSLHHADSPSHATDERDASLNLSAAKILSTSQLLWTTPGIGSRLAGAAASKVIRTAVDRLAPDDRPAPFTHAKGIDVYRVTEPVLDVRSVVAALADPLRSDLAVLSASPAASLRVVPSASGVSHIDLTVPASASQAATAHHIHATRFILAAGAGNESLLAQAFPDAPSRPAALAPPDRPRMQLRPLHMILLRAHDLPAIFGHCVGMSDKPRITITTSRDSHGVPVWYIGGLLAEHGVPRSREDQIAAAKQEVAACLPWLDLDRFAPQWATWRVDRAEGLSPDGSRPDEPVVQSLGNVIAAWPTKLAFAPLVAMKIESLLREVPDIRAVRDSRAAGVSMEPPAIASPAVAPTAVPHEASTTFPSLFASSHHDLPIAAYPWDRSEVQWTS